MSEKDGREKITKKMLQLNDRKEKIKFKKLKILKFKNNKISNLMIEKKFQVSNLSFFTFFLIFLFLD
jgi:hypothetical protein